MFCCSPGHDTGDATELVTADVIDDEYGSSGRLCKMGCGKAAQPGLTKRGNPYDTCCRSCVVNPGLGIHDPACGGAAGAPARPACPKGSRCRDRDDDHLKSHAHPLDQDYAICCTKSRIEAEPVSLKVLFDWADADGSGKLTPEELQATMHVIQERCGDALPTMTEESWKSLDEDGNGVINFKEFAAWAGPRTGLPLGMQKLMRTASGASSARASRPCHAMGCPCEHFEDQGVPAAAGEVAASWAATLGVSGLMNDWVPMTCKQCKHKLELHFTKQQDGEVLYPDYWDNTSGPFNKRIELSSAIEDFQSVFNKTYKHAMTRDRRRHNPTRPQVPKGFEVVKVTRNENSDSWEEYACRRAEIQTRVQEGKMDIERYDTVKSTVAWREVGGAKADRLAPEVNEWYLFHGTNPEVAQKICETDFLVGCAGSSTGTLYGKGMYFAESITKADEYAKPDGNGNYAMLVCRVLGGRVLYTQEDEPDPEYLVRSCIEGPFDCVLGDREKLRGTYREFVLFDSEDVYPEYIVEYKRQYQ